jgi:acyl carrier protein
VENVEEKVKGLLMESFDMKPEEVTLEANLGDDLEMDSLEIVELVVALEKEFKVQIGDGTISNKNCVNDVVKVVQDRLKK